MSQKFKSQIDAEEGIKIDKQLYDANNSAGTSGQILSSTGTAIDWVDASTLAFGESEQVHIACKNTSGVAISKGDPVYITGTVGTSYIVEIAAADASNSAKMPAVGLAETDLGINAEGFVIVSGVLKNLTTDPLSTGDGTPSSNDTVYVKAGGGLTRTKPTGSGNLIQNVGKVGRVNSSNAGSLAVSTIMRTNDVPNLTTGKIWVGSSTYTTESGVIHLDETNNRLGVNETSPSSDLHVNNDSTSPVLRLSYEPSGGYGGGGDIRIQGAANDYVYGGINWYNGANRDAHFNYAAASRAMDFKVNERGVSTNGYFRFYNGSTEVAEINANGIYGNVFYDQGNTSYYLDPAGSSSLNTINVTTINRNPTVTLSGDVSGSATMTNLGSINITTTVANDSHDHSNYVEISGDTMTGTLTVPNLIIGSGNKIQFANNDYIRYDDAANRFHFDADGGTSNASVQAATFVGALSTTGISGSNYNITGVNQIEINDPGEGIIWKGGSSGDITLAVVDDTSDNILRLSGTNAELQVGTNRVLTTADEGSGNGLDADTLDGQQGSYYLDYNNFTNTPTIPSAYTHPTHPGDDINLDTGPLTGATVISDLDFNVTTDTLGHVTDANATYSTRNLTASDLGIASTELVKNYQNQNYIASGGTTGDYRDNYGIGVTVYEGYSTGSNRPHSYDSTVQFMSTTQQGFELSVDWLSSSTTPLKIRSLRDCCQGWSSWVDVAVSGTTSSGVFSTTGDYRAPIFYDYNNTSYYANPAGTSVLNVLNLAGDLSVGGGDITLSGTGRIQGIDTVSAGTDAANKTYVDNAVAGVSYTHPTHPGDDINLDTGPLTGATVISDLDFNITTDTLGHVTDANATYSTRSLTASDVGAAASSHTHTWADISGETSNSVNSWGGLRHQTNDGYIDFGPANTSHAHIYTDRPNFYLNKPLTVSGSSIINSGDIRSAIFYDLDNTSYYTNPSGTSTILDLTTAGLFQQPTNDEYFVTSGKQVTSVNDAWSMNISTSKNVGLQTFRFQNGVTGAPSTNDNANWGINIYSHSGSSGGYPYGVQLAGGNNDAQALYLRRFSNGSAQTWRKIWHEGSDGSGSGLDADLLDGQHGSYYATASSLGNYLPLSGGTMSGSINLNNNNLTNVNNITINDAGAGEGIQWNGGNGWKIFESPDTFTNAAGNLQFVTGSYTQKFTIDTSGNTFSSSSSRAPIFYDSNDTGYYVDPNSTSQSARLRGQIYIGPNTSSKYLRLGGNGGATDVSTISTSNGNLHIDATTGYNLYLAWYNTSDVIIGGQVQATRYYDRNNTAYYVDPASTSVLNDVSGTRIWAGYDSNVDNSVSCSNWFRSSGSTGWYNGSYGGGIYMADSTWVRVYNNKKFYADDTIESNTGMYAPIFYDRNDTSYYVDPASTSTAARLNGDILLSNGKYFGFDTSFGTPGINNYFGALSTNTTLYVGGPTGTTTNLYSGYSRASIFYNRANSAYYMDGDNTGDSIRVAGDVVAYYSSDKRLKDNIKPIENALDKVNAISGVTFEWNEKSHKTTGRKDVGVIAQEVEEVFPEIVETRSNGYKAVDYQKLTAVLIESVKELTAKVEALESKQCNCK